MTEWERNLTHGAYAEYERKIHRCIDGLIEYGAHLSGNPEMEARYQQIRDVVAHMASYWVLDRRDLEDDWSAAQRRHESEYDARCRALKERGGGPEMTAATKTAVLDGLKTHIDQMEIDPQLPETIERSRDLEAHLKAAWHMDMGNSVRREISKMAEERKTLSPRTLDEFKQLIKPGMELKTLHHNNWPELAGLVRIVTRVDEDGYYTAIKGQPDHALSRCNDGAGLFSGYLGEDSYVFGDHSIKELDPSTGNREEVYEIELYAPELALDSEKRHLTCLNCENEFDGELSLDDLGWHSACPECGGSFDVDAPDKRFVIAFADDRTAEAQKQYFKDEFTGAGILTLHSYATAKEFIEGWTRLAENPESMWYWCLDTYENPNGYESGAYCICSGACDPNDIELLAEYPPLREAAMKSALWNPGPAADEKSGQQREMGGISQ